SFEERGSDPRVGDVVRLARPAEEARPLPPRRLGHESTGCSEPVVEWAAPDAARGRVLAVGPVHVEEQAERFSRPVIEVLAVRLERHHPPYVDIGELNRRVAVADPVRERLADTARGEHADRVEAARAIEIVDLRRL